MGLTGAGGGRDQVIQEHHNPHHRSFAASVDMGVQRESAKCSGKNEEGRGRNRDTSIQTRSAYARAIVGRQRESDGSRPRRELRASGRRTGNARQLTALGFVGEVSASPARPELASLVIETLGPEAMDIAKEIEQCKSSDELHAYFTSRREMFNRAMIKPRADAFWKRVGELLQ